MPKRVVDGDALWRSRKLLLVPPQYRGEYANLLPLADVNGSFECDPASIWADVYSYNRANITVADVTSILDAFEAAGMLVHWQQEGKSWGYFVGIHRPGRLPSGKHLSRHRNLPPLPPEPVKSGSQDAIGDSGMVPDIPGVSRRVLKNPPLGLGLGKGLNSKASGTFPEDLSSQWPAERSEDFDGHEWALKTLKAHILWKDPDALTLSPVLASLYMETIQRDAQAKGGLLAAAKDLYARTVQFTKTHKERGTEERYISSPKNFLADGVYATVEMPAVRKWLPVESDEECEKRLREEGRERRRAANAATEVAAKV